MPRGRPRDFDADEALEKAMRVFWSRGFEGATLEDLTGAMGISRPSMYAAFGNKEAIFRKAMERYAAGPARHMLRSLEEPTARRVVEKLWRGTVELLSNPKNPTGCFAMRCSLDGGRESEKVRQEAKEQRLRAESALRKRFERAKKEGDFGVGVGAGAGVKPEDLARFVLTINHGMAVEAAGGASGKQLLAVVELALRAWPGR